MILSVHSLYNYLIFVILFFLFFSGNATILGVDLFFVVFCFTIIFLLIPQERKNLTTSRRSHVLLNLVVMLVLYLVFVKSVHLNIPYYEYYYLWPLKCAALLLIIFCLRGIWRNRYNVYNFRFFIFASAFAFISMALIFGQRDIGRLSFIFGPNVLYRVFIFFVVTLIVSLRYKHKGVSTAVVQEYFLIILLLFLLSIVGSRGSLLVFAFVIVFLLYPKSFFKVQGVVFLLLLSFLVFFLLSNLLSDSRIVRFSGFDSNLRYVFLTDFFLNVSSVPVFGFDWNDFLKYQSPGFHYPHNIVAELVFYYGILGVGLSLVMLCSFVRGVVFVMASERNASGNLFDYLVITAYFVLAPSTLFSGDLADNFPAIAIACYGVCAWKVDIV